MKRYLALAACLWPAFAYGQQTYTNADLVRFQVPGAYTNQDLRRLPPVAAPKAVTGPPSVSLAPPAPVSDWQSAYDEVKRTRDALANELDYELARVRYSESAFAGSTDDFEPRFGYAAKVTPLVWELKKRVALLDKEIEAIADEARRDRAPIDPR
jgi:hypothetical protein